MKVKRRDLERPSRLHHGHIWLNCVGTDGVASADYCCSSDQNALLFADGLNMIASKTTEIKDMLVKLLLDTVPIMQVEQFRLVNHCLSLVKFRFGTSELAAPWN